MDKYCYLSKRKESYDSVHVSSLRFLCLSRYLFSPSPTSHPVITFPPSLHHSLPPFVSFFCVPTDRSVHETREPSSRSVMLRGPVFKPVGGTKASQVPSFPKVGQRRVRGRKRSFKRVHPCSVDLLPVHPSFPSPFAPPPPPSPSLLQPCLIWREALKENLTL